MDYGDIAEPPYLVLIERLSVYDGLGYTVCILYKKYNTSQTLANR